MCRQVVLVLLAFTSSYLLFYFHNFYPHPVSYELKPASYLSKQASDAIEAVSKLLQPDVVYKYAPAFYNETEIKGINRSVVATGRCFPQPRYLPLPRDNLFNCSLPYVTMNWGARTGNKICQYMSLSLLRKVFGVRVSLLNNLQKPLEKIFFKLDLPGEDPECFPRYTRSIRFTDLYRKLVAESRKVVLSDEQPTHYPLKETVYVKDNPCPPDMLFPFRDQFRQELVFKKELTDKARQKIDEGIKALGIYTNKNITKVTVHVRRTDYIGYIKSRFQLTPLDKLYFQRAFDFFRKKVPYPVFLVTSDDPKWCKENLIDKDVAFVGSFSSVDLALLSFGDHHIISYGTFGFVSSFLGRGIIVYPYSEKSWPFFRCINTPMYQPIHRD
ncbi:galactoside alpha-(1,2)-fucosyltransferase 1-like [Homarus americanus]|uniref:galactoside alpha-(1,2)-fucosyltransferase 1-like n=1 Tax=Homarus americanus TaxID=6706 RepID=UPI001C467AA6|nr:galactoside alpha-(1,2)-fucosyltransferase 1-like [Homarus americanus]